MQGWNEVLLTAASFNPVFNYAGGKNILRVNLPRRSIDPSLLAVISVLIGILAGIALKYLLPAGIEQNTAKEILTPLSEFWIRMLSVLSSPVVFLTICTAVMNVWEIEEIGGSSSRVIVRYFLLSLAAAFVSLVFAGFARGGMIIFRGMSGTRFSDFLEMILAIMPENILNPFVSGDSAQICLIAVVLGNAICMMGSKATSLGRLVRQGNMVGLHLTKVVSRFVPFFAAVMIIKEILESRTLLLMDMWKIVLLSLLASAVFMGIVTAYVCIRKDVPARVLISKIRQTFLGAVTITSSRRENSRNQEMEMDSLGVEKHFAEKSLTYALVLYMPANVIGTILFTVFAAVRYDVGISVRWVVYAVVLSIVLFIATPPVPGANLLAYIMIFEQLGIPSAAFIDAVVFEILFGIFAGAINRVLDELDLVLQADRIGLLDREMLKR